MTDILRPVAPAERIGALDLLRGWAMFGVLWSNLNDNYGTRDPATSLDRALAWTQEWLIESRFYSLLILLFGIGFGIQLLRATERGLDVRKAYYRRSAALLVIGVVHGTLIWRGDILTIYALVSFALVMFRTTSTRRILVAALLLWFVGGTVVRELMWFSGLRIMLPGASGESAAIYAHGSWAEIERIRVAGYLQWLGRWGLTSYVGILASFLVGLWAVKSGYLYRVVREPRVTLRLLALVLVALAITLASKRWGAAIWPPVRVPADAPLAFPYPYFQLQLLQQFVMGFFGWWEKGTAVLYACILLLIWQRPLGKRVLSPLAAAGRMALTTYLTQSIVCTILFYSYGFGWYGNVGFTGMFVITIVLFACQMAASTWWLARYRYGPAEWLWRTLTYGSAPEMRVAQG